MAQVKVVKRKHLELKARLLSVTRENTELLREVASLKQEHTKVEADIKDASASQGAKPSKACDAASQRAKLLATNTRQEQEIELLKLEIQKLKCKCGHVSAESSRLPLL